MPIFSANASTNTGEPESAYAWLRLAAAVLVGTVGSVGMWSMVVALPVIQADFGIARADASLPYTFSMIGFAAGAVLAGRLVDRLGVAIPVVLGALALGMGYFTSSFAGNIWQ